VKNGKFLAAFGANNATPRQWTSTEIALVRDVAERTWDAVERTRAEAALREREQRLHLALDASAAGVWTWDAQTNRLDWDERVHAHYGLVPAVPRNLDTWSSALHPDDRQRVLDRLEHVLSCTDDNDWNETFRIVRPDGTVRWMQGLGKAERETDGRVTRSAASAWTSPSAGVQRRHCRRGVTRNTIASCGCCWKPRRKASSRSMRMG
jgi:PAS domain S-box-containing protein